MSLRLHLPQRNTDADPAVAVAGHRRRLLTSKHRIDHAPLGRKGCGIAARGHHPLKGMMVRGVERPGLAQAVPRRSGQAGPAQGRTGYSGQNVAPAFTM